MKPADKNPGFIILMILIICLFMPIFLSTPVHADFGPKPSITIIVKNPPNEEYYLDLLIREEQVNNSLQDEKDKYDPLKFELFQNYNDDGWVPALVHGTKIPLFGRLTGTRQGKDVVHTFSYFGTPEHFKIMIVTPENRVVVSNELVRQTYQHQLTYDYETGAIGQRSKFTTYVIQFLSTLLPTLLIEGLILLLFGFSLKKSYKVFLWVNLATQVALTATLGTAAITHGMFTAYFLAVPAELAIIIMESIAFSRLLKEHTKGRRVAFAVTANIVSIIASLIAMNIMIG